MFLIPARHILYDVDMLPEEDVKKYLEAGRIARRVIALALDTVEEGASLLEVAEKLEGEIYRSGAMPAFPVNISLNWVAAHYSPGIRDTTTIPGKSIVKIDVGVHVDGRIADAAFTVSFNPEHQRLVEASREALKEAESMFRPGTSLRDVGRIIQRVIERFGYKPVSNLSGHKVDVYKLHAGKSVPNVVSFTFAKILEGEVYAIEPFATNGEGYVVESGESNIFRISSLRRIKGEKDLNAMLRVLWNRYRSLPFSNRWVARDFGERSLERFYDLVSKGRVYPYPMLAERRRGFVSQFEDTVIVTEEGAVVTTGVLELL